LSPEDSFERALEREYERAGSNFQFAREAAGGTNRDLARALGVDIRTVQRWAKFEAGAGGQGRNPERSPQAGRLGELADEPRHAAAMRALEEMTSFDTDSVDVENVSGGSAEDEGARHAQTMVDPLDLHATMDLYRSGASRAEVGESFAAALGASYGLPETIVITNIEGLRLH
jgi:transcriptional regulator with XRE-family HTH domain